MKVFRSVQSVAGRCHNVAVTVGNFDGVHLGHQHLIRTVVERARRIGGTSMVFTFFPHPLKILATGECPPLLTTLEQKVEIIEALGPDIFLCEDFTREFASQSPERFVREVLREQLDVVEVVEGEDYRFGRGRGADIQGLRQLSAECGLRLTVLDTFSINGKPVKSTDIRRAIALGEIEGAAEMLGRPYALTGRVVEGERLGIQLGFPTANIAPEQEVIPADGVYAVRVGLKSPTYPAVANIGRRPTFPGDKRTVETHLLGFNDELYGKRIELSFIRRLREERKFESPEALKEQIAKDIEAAKQILGVP